MAGVRLELWQATASGCYIHPNQPSCPDGGDPETSRLWGHALTDAQGRYAFETIKPGKYLNGSRYRPSHIHFRIRTPAGAANPVDLVTQLYFQGDPDIAGDFGADEPGARARTIPLSGGTGSLTGVFNVTLPGNTTGIDIAADPALRNFDVLVQRRGAVFTFHLPPAPASTEIHMSLYNASGRLLQRSTYRSTPVEVDMAMLPRGGYLAEFSWAVGQGMRTESVWLRF